MIILITHILFILGNCKLFIDIKKNPDPTVFHEKYYLAMVTGRINEISLVWSGTEWGLAWEEEFYPDKEINFMRFTSDGKTIGDLLCVSDIGSPSHPRLIWNGEMYTLAWGYKNDDKCCVKIVNIDNGEKVELSEINTNSNVISHPTITRAGDQYSVAWSDIKENINKINAAIIDENGKMIENYPVVIVGDQNDMENYKRPSLILNREQYAMAWRGNTGNDKKLYFHTFSNFDLINKNDVYIVKEKSTRDIMNLDLGSNGNEYGLYWEEKDENTKYYSNFSLIRYNNNKVIQFDLSLSGELENPPDSSISWNNEGFIVSWHDNSGEQGSGMYVSYITSNGSGMNCDTICIENEPSPPPSQITASSPIIYSSSSIAWDGRDFGLVYSKKEKDKSEIIFLY